MDRAEAFLEGQPAFERRHHHLASRIPIGAVLDRPDKIASRPAGTVQGDRLGGRIVARRQIGLDAVGQRIHPRRGCQERGQAHGEVRVADGSLGNEVGRDEAELAPVREGHQGGAADLAACAGGGRDGDDRRHRVGDLGNAAENCRHRSRARHDGSPAARRPWRDRSESRRPRRPGHRIRAPCRWRRRSRPPPRWGWRAPRRRASRPAGPASSPATARPVRPRPRLHRRRSSAVGYRAHPGPRQGRRPPRNRSGWW